MVPRGLKNMLAVVVFMRMACLGLNEKMAVHTTPSPDSHVEITPMSRIVRHEQVDPDSLIQEEAKNPEPMELNPNIIGGGEGTTTSIVISGEGPTTTAIYAVGSAPGPQHSRTASPNARALEPIYEPGAPGPPGVAGPPGPPGEPGPADGSVGTTIHPYHLAHDYAQSGYEVRGDKGGIGAPGLHGNQGAIGSRGLMGDLGHRGHLGIAGPKGERGPPGKPNHANAVQFNWLIYVIIGNSALTFLVFVVSYMEFVMQKEIISPCCATITCGCCGSRGAKSVDSAAQQGEWDGYEQ